MHGLIDFAAFDFGAWTAALAAMAVFALAGWLLSLVLRDVSIVDSMWPLFFVLALVVYLRETGTDLSGRPLIVTALVGIWALRLAVYLTWRNHGEPEDRRYQAIRRNNEPHFWFKSLYIVFGLQCFLAWVLCLPTLAAVSGQASPGPTSDFSFSDILFWAGVALWVAGLWFEATADWQLARFRSRPDNAGTVLDRGLWRYTRHPNYFGEFTLWWGFFLMAAAAGGAWTIISPLLLTVLLLRVSGVSMMEKDISDRRPEYRRYIAGTNAFFPWRPQS